MSKEQLVFGVVFLLSVLSICTILITNVTDYKKYKLDSNFAGVKESGLTVDEAIDKVIFIRDSFGNWKPHYYINGVETVAERLIELDHE